MSQPIDIPTTKEQQTDHLGLSPEERKVKTDKLLVRLSALRSKIKNHENIDVRKI